MTVSYIVKNAESVLLLPRKWLHIHEINSTLVDVSLPQTDATQNHFSFKAWVRGRQVFSFIWTLGIMKATKSSCLSKSSFHHSSQSLNNCIIYIRLQTHTSRPVSVCVCVCVEKRAKMTRIHTHTHTSLIWYLQRTNTSAHDSHTAGWVNNYKRLEDKTLNLLILKCSTNLRARRWGAEKDQQWFKIFL